MVAEIDESLGQIVSSLGDRGMLKNSIIVFMTDNGAPTIGKFRNWGSNWPLRGASVFINKSNIIILYKKLILIYRIIFIVYIRNVKYLRYNKICILKFTHLKILI